MESLEFQKNHRGEDDVALFDFTSLYAAENAARIVERGGKRALMCLVGDSLIEVSSRSTVMFIMYTVSNHVCMLCVVSPTMYIWGADCSTYYVVCTVYVCCVYCVRSSVVCTVYNHVCMLCVLSPTMYVCCVYCLQPCMYVVCTVSNHVCMLCVLSSTMHVCCTPTLHVSSNVYLCLLPPVIYPVFTVSSCICCVNCPQR